VEDPLDLFGYRLLEGGKVCLEDLQRVHAEVEEEVQAAMERARAAPDAGAGELGLEDVYS
jgi:TPP-dependent pyruvate/acetoin dehydrogenase alpha subunit